MAETGGFEPPVEFNPDPSLAVKSNSAALARLHGAQNECIPIRISGSKQAGQFGIADQTSPMSEKQRAIVRVIATPIHAG